MCVLALLCMCMCTVYGVLFSPLWLKFVPGWPAISVSSWQDYSLGHMIWFGKMSNISQLPGSERGAGRGGCVPSPWCISINARSTNKGLQQCCGSMTFWCGSGSGSADPCLWLMDPDPFVIDIQDANKKLIFILFFLLITFWRYIYIFFQR